MRCTHICSQRNRQGSEEWIDSPTVRWLTGQRPRCSSGLSNDKTIKCLQVIMATLTLSSWEMFLEMSPCDNRAGGCLLSSWMLLPCLNTSKDVLGVCHALSKVLNVLGGTEDSKVWFWPLDVWLSTSSDNSTYGRTVGHCWVSTKSRGQYYHSNKLSRNRMGSVWAAEESLQHGSVVAKWIAERRSSEGG